MENATPGVTGTPASDKTPDQIEREMEATRGSITEKVSLLESQVMGNVQSVTTAVASVKDVVTDTVQTLKDAVSSAPSAVSDTVKQTVAAVKDTVKETVSSISLSDTVRSNPLAAVGTSAAVGFLTGFFLLGGRSSGGLFSRPLMARGSTVPESGGRVSGVQSAYAGHDAGGREPVAAQAGFFGSLIASVGNELRQVAEQAITTAVASLKQNVSTQVPHLVDTAVHNVTDRVAGAVNGSATDRTARVGGPTYTATAPTTGG